MHSGAKSPILSSRTIDVVLSKQPIDTGQNKLMKSIWKFQSHARTKIECQDEAIIYKKVIFLLKQRSQFGFIKPGTMHYWPFGVFDE